MGAGASFLLGESCTIPLNASVLEKDNSEVHTDVSRQNVRLQSQLVWVLSISHLVSIHLRFLGVYVHVCVNAHVCVCVCVHW